MNPLRSREATNGYHASVNGCALALASSLTVAAGTIQWTATRAMPPPFAVKSDHLYSTDNR